MIVAFSFKKIDDFGTSDEIISFVSNILHDSCHRFGLDYQFVFSELEFVLEVCGEEETILEFSNYISSLIPLSLQWVFDEFYVIESFSRNGIKELTCKSKLNLLTPLEIDRLSLKDNDEFCDLWSEFIGFKQSKIQLFKDENKIEISNKFELRDILQEISEALKLDKSVFLKTIFGKKKIVLFREDKELKVDRDYLFMPFCLNNLQTIFRVKKEEQQALATIEKPIIELKAKSVFGQFFGSSTKCILPFEPLLILLGKFLPEYSGIFLFDIDNYKMPFGLCYFVDNDISENRISVGSNSLILKHKFGNSKPILEFKDIINRYSLERTSCIYLGDRSTNCFVYFNNTFKEPIKFAFETNLKVIFDILKIQDETTSKLYSNFRKENENLCLLVDSMESDAKISTNLLDLVGVCGYLLDLVSLESHIYDARNAVHRCASEFMGEKGPRIDFRLIREDDKIFLDTFRTIRSVMSFKLAGVEKELLCFGILDSLAEFLANFSRDMHENYQLKDTIICGSMFLNKQFLDKFIHYHPKSSEIFPCTIMDFEE